MGRVRSGPKERKFAGAGCREREVVSCVTSGKAVWLFYTATFMARTCLASACVSLWLALGAGAAC
eukprot:5077121-Pleurochrysis_carterae.AAC.1